LLAGCLQLMRPSSLRVQLPWGSNHSHHQPTADELASLMEEIMHEG
jgi:hypothetical protein